MALTRLQPAALQPSSFSGLNITDGSLYPVDLSTGAPLWDSTGSITIQTPNTSSSYLKFSSPNTTTAAMIGGYDDGTNSGHLEFYTKNAGTVGERMRITSSGLVGINTLTPVNKLDMIMGAQGIHASNIAEPYYGSMLMFDADAGSANQGWRLGARYASGVGTAFVVELKSDATYSYASNANAGATTGFTEYFRINSNGKVGVGVSAPLKNVDIVGTDSSTTTVGIGLAIRNTNSTNDSRAGISFMNYDNWGASIWSPRTGSSAGVLAFGINNASGVAETNIVERLRIENVSNGGGQAFVKLAPRVPIGHARWHFSPAGATTSYTATLALPSTYGIWELSVYAWRNVSGQYGTYYGCWHIAGLDGYPYMNWGSSFVQISSFTMNQTAGGPTLTSLTTGANGAVNLTLGNYPGGITIVARLMTDGQGY